MHRKLINLEQAFQPSPLLPITNTLLTTHSIQLWLKRDDLIHPIISGNKWRKLKYCLNDALTLGNDTLISMGGAYSNHLHALAYIGKELGMKTVGLIRGERPQNLNPTLHDLLDWGMDLRFVSRSDYRQLRTYKNQFVLPGLNSNEYWLPEGGYNPLALKGVTELVAEIAIDYDFVCVACGTGTTLAGLINAMPDKTVLGFAAFKNANYLTSEVQAMLAKNCHNWEIIQAYHFGGFAKLNAELESFIDEFERLTSTLLEPVYTGKMLYGLFDLIGKGYFKPSSRIIAIHTGGLQGNRGFC